MNNKTGMVVLATCFISIYVAHANLSQDGDRIVYPLELIRKRPAAHSNVFEPDDARLVAQLDDINSPFNSFQLAMIEQIRSVAPQASLPSTLREIAIDLDSDGVEEKVLFEFNEFNDPGEVTFGLIDDGHVRCEGIAVFVQSYGEWRNIMYHRSSNILLPEIEDGGLGVGLNILHHTDREVVVKVKVRNIRVGQARQWCVYTSDKEDSVDVGECLPRIIPAGSM